MSMIMIPNIFLVFTASSTLSSSVNSEDVQQVGTNSHQNVSRVEIRLLKNALKKWVMISIVIARKSLIVSRLSMVKWQLVLGLVTLVPALLQRWTKKDVVTPACVE